MVELVDTLGLRSGEEIRAGSNPAKRNVFLIIHRFILCF